MRTLAMTAVLLTLLAGCIHLPADVAAVVRESDPPARNNFRPEPLPERTANHAPPVAP